MSGITEVLLVGHTHHDIGYTNSPRIVDPMHRRIVEEVLDLCEAPADEDRAAMRWTFEVSRPVVEFVRRAGAASVGRLRRLVDAGRLSVTAGYLNMTQLVGEHELDAAYEMLSLLRDAGISIRTEQHGDVNGIAWGAVPAMRRAGLDRLVMALNPDHGRPPFEQPTGFWWVGPGGQRVFVWLSTHYGIGEEWGVIDADVDESERRISDFLERLEARADYPYDVAVVHAANDNRWPTNRFLDVARHWNGRHPDVPMRTATIDQALDRIVAQARRAAVPVVAGEWSDWWSHGHGSTAREVSVYRAARSHAITGQVANGLALLRGDGHVPPAIVIGYRRGPVRLRTAAELAEDLQAVDEQLLLFGEHTWGAWESFSKPHSTYTHSHWNAKAGFAYDAYDIARDVAVEGLFRLVHAAPDRDGRRPDAEDTVIVLNPTARTRTEPVAVEIDGRSERVVVCDVPGFGVARAPIPSPLQVRGPGRRIGTTRYEADVDPARGGVVSLIHRPTRRQLVDPDASWGLGSVVSERMPAGSTHPMVQDPKRFRPEDPGPAFERNAATSGTEPQITEGPDHVAITWRTTAPTMPDIEATLRLYADLDIVDVEVTITKDEVLAPESIFVAFPFAAREPRFLLETAGAVYTAEDEQLPDTSKDWYSIQHAIGIDGADGGILWGSYDAPLVQLGGIHTGRWARSLDAASGHVNSWVMNNLHFTNFRASQGGTQSFRYRFAARPDGVHRPEVRLFGRDVLAPLVARQHRAGGRWRGSAGLLVSPGDETLVDVRPTGDDQAVRVRLRPLSPAAVTVELGWAGPSPVDVVSIEVQTADPARIPNPMLSRPVVLSRGSDPIRVPLGGNDVADVVLRRAA